MQTIVVANPKGGSGKTTLATNVAGWLAGKRRDVVLRDLDPAAFRDRMARAPSDAVSADRGARARSEGRQGTEHDWRVVDTPAGLHGDDLREAVRRADVMLVR
jgi:chromosome partitioning protein